MPKAKVGDINIYYEIHGKGEPLVMIMGGGGSVEWFFRDIPVFSREFKVIVFDNRGTGRSDKPDIPYTTEMLADDLAGLMDAIGIGTAHVQGGSMGGMIAQQFASRYPKKVRSLILMCTYCGGPHSIMLNPEVMAAWERMQSLPLKERTMETFRICVSQKFIDNNLALIQQMMEHMTKRPVYMQTRQAQAVVSHNTYDRLPEIKVPTLVMHGDADQCVPVENARILASRIPGAELVILKNMGHMFMFEAEEEFHRIMLDFLRRHRRSAS